MNRGSPLLNVEPIISRVCGGETELFADLVREFQPQVWKTAAAMLGCMHSTEDVVQQTFVQAFLKLDQYRSGEDFGVWLKQIARNIVRQRLRGQSRESKRILVYKDRLLAQMDDPRRADRQADYEAALSSCKETLSERQKTILDLRYRESLTFSDIADRVEGSVEAIRRMAARSRTTLRQCVEQKMANS